MARSKVNNFNIKCKSYSRDNLGGKKLAFFFTHPFQHHILEKATRRPYDEGLAEEQGVCVCNFTNCANGTHLPPPLWLSLMSVAPVIEKARWGKSAPRGRVT